MEREAPVSTTKLIGTLLILAATSRSGGPVVAMTARSSSFPVVVVVVDHVMEKMSENLVELYTAVC